MKPPDFWYRPQGQDGWCARALAPLGQMVALAGCARRALTRPFNCQAPVLCIGNITTGGQGKTPTALAIAQILQARGVNVWFLTRGYGGRLSGPVQVMGNIHDSAAVGDEALLLAEQAPTLVSRNRARGAALACARGAQLIIMDDGFQNPGLYQDQSWLVVDGTSGFGNGRMIPAGPLREPVAAAFRRATALVMIGPDRHHIAAHCPANVTVLSAQFQPLTTLDAGKRYYAFAGIGRPGKFFETVRVAAQAAGGSLAGCAAFADHHPYDQAELAKLSHSAERLDATLVTTTKDFMRLPEIWRQRVRAFAVTLVFADIARLDPLLGQLLDRLTAGSRA